LTQPINRKDAAGGRAELFCQIGNFTDIGRGSVGLEAGMRIALSVLAMAMLAAACSRKGEAAKGETVAQAPKPAVTDIGSAGPRPGKWKMTTTHGVAGAPQTVSVEVCVPKTTFKEMQALQQKAGMSCGEQTMDRVGNAIVSHAACTHQGGRIIVDSRMTGDFNARYTMESTTVMDPAPTPSMREMKMTIIAERLGDC
jgi:hypothetical protein